MSAVSHRTTRRKSISVGFLHPSGTRRERVPMGSLGRGQQTPGGSRPPTLRGWFARAATRRSVASANVSPSMNTESADSSVKVRGSMMPSKLISTSIFQKRSHRPEWSAQPLDTSAAVTHTNEGATLEFLTGGRDYVYQVSRTNADHSGTATASPPTMRTVLMTPRRRWCSSRTRRSGTAG